MMFLFIIERVEREAATPVFGLERVTKQKKVKLGKNFIVI